MTFTKKLLGAGMLTALLSAPAAAEPVAPNPHAGH